MTEKLIVPYTMPSGAPLIPNELAERLMANWEGLKHSPSTPVLKLFMPGTACRWLLSALDPNDHDLAFGLADLGVAPPEMGHIRLNDIAAFGEPIERDLYITLDKPLIAYWEEWSSEADARAGQ
jgi:hypothetical protein